MVDARAEFSKKPSSAELLLLLNWDTVPVQDDFHVTSTEDNHKPFSIPIPTIHTASVSHPTTNNVSACWGWLFRRLHDRCGKPTRPGGGGERRDPLLNCPSGHRAGIRHDGNIYHARAILDTGAAISFMTEAAASALRLKRTFQPLQVTGTTGEGQCKFAVTTSIMSSDGQYVSQPIRFAIVPELPKLQVPSNSSEILTIPTFRTYRLADPKLGGSVDILLGVHDCLQMITGPAFQVQGLSALPTQLGLCLSGHLQSSESPLALVATIPPTDLQDDLSKLWELDRVPESPKLSPDDQQVINDFDKSYSLCNGRFSVSLPRTADPPKLGESRRQAVSRLLQNEKSLTRKGKLEAFQTAVREYVDLGHAHIIPNHQLRPPDDHFYLPVHGVFKDSSSTTKVRAVFDASARTSSTFSLNDTLLPGPNLYPPLTDILLRFRKFPIAMSADISKMFREILLNPSEKDFHRFVMRDAASKIVDCRMDRLTFGVKSSPFLATQVLHTLASLHASSHPSAAHAITHNFYVDDFLAGAESVIAASSLQRELSDLLSKAGMVLRKWRSNSSELISTIPDSLHDDSSSLLIPTPSMAPKARSRHLPKMSPNDRCISHGRCVRCFGSVFTSYFACENSLAGNMEKVTTLGLSHP